MLTQICAEIRNYFCGDDDRIVGNYAVSEGKLVPSISIKDGQYYRIVGSVFNDGVHHSDDVLIDEEDFHGAVWLMSVPQDIIELANEITEWQNKNADVLSSPYQSESFGGYSYSKASGYNGNRDTVNSYSWQDAFAVRLKPYRRIRVL